MLKTLFSPLGYQSCFCVAVQLFIVSNSLQPHELQHTSLPRPSLFPGVCSNSCPLSQRCHPTISSSAIPFSSCLQSFPALGSFPVSQFFASGDQSIGASASTSVLPINIQHWFPLGLTSLISLLSQVTLKSLNQWFDLIVSNLIVFSFSDLPSWNLSKHPT